jgi:hypothetical protein
MTSPHEFTYYEPTPTQEAVAGTREALFRAASSWGDGPRHEEKWSDVVAAVSDFEVAVRVDEQFRRRPLIEAARAYRDARLEYISSSTKDNAVALYTATVELDSVAARTFEVSHEA